MRGEDNPKRAFAREDFPTEGLISGISIPQDVIDLAQSPGRHHIGLALPSGDMVHIVVDDDASLTPDQMVVTLDVYAPQVSWAKEIEAGTMKQVRTPRGVVLVRDDLLDKVRAEMISVPLGTGVIRTGPNDATNWTNNCSNGQTMMLSRPPGYNLMESVSQAFLVVGKTPVL